MNKYIIKTTTFRGRLCNRLIRNLAVSFIAKKHDLLIEYCDSDKIEKLGIFLFTGTKFYNKESILTDENYFLYLNKENIESNINPNFDFFQTKEITNMIYSYLRNENKDNIIASNIFKERYKNNNDIFIHI